MAGAANPTSTAENATANDRVQITVVRSAVISAGYINEQPLRELCAVVDAIKIDLKGINERFYEEVCFATLSPVLDAIRTVAQNGVHLEIVNLVVPKHNDASEDLRALARWVREEIGPDVPLHFSRFGPMYRMQNLRDGLLRQA